jgi:outer membrane lipoprotein-sorting protein
MKRSCCKAANGTDTSLSLRAVLSRRPAKIKLFVGLWALAITGLALAQDPSDGSGSAVGGGLSEKNSWQTSKDVPVILVKAIQEQKQGRYIGRLVRQFERGPLHLKHEEIVYRDGPRTRVEFPAGSNYVGQVIVETANDWRYYQPKTNTIFVRPPRREENLRRMVGLARRASKRQISMSIDPGERIAGIDTKQVVVRDSYNTIIERLYIDPRSGVLLKRVVFGAMGAQTGYFQFNEINLNPGPFSPTLFQLDKPGAKIVTPGDTLREIALKQGFEPVLFPGSTGLRLEQSRVTSVEREQVLVESFSSPKGRITLFELKNAVSPTRLKSMTQNEMQTYSWQRGDKWFVLVGPKSAPSLALEAPTLFTQTP